MEEIRIWFNGKRDYAAGVALYLKHGSDPTLKRLFTAEGYSDFKNTKLKTALESLLAGNKTLPTGGIKEVILVPAKDFIEPKSPDRVPEQKIIPPEKSWNENPDATESALKAKWKPLYAEMMYLVANLEAPARQGLKDPNKKEEAGRMALKILDLAEQCKAIYSDRDYYRTHGVLPGEKKPVDIALDSALWHKKLDNAQHYIAKFKRRLEKDPSDVKAAQLIKKWETVELEYKKLLKMI